MDNAKIAVLFDSVQPVVGLGGVLSTIRRRFLLIYYEGIHIFREI
jgi:hypothetical protein